MISEAHGRLAAILRRELGAADVQIVHADDAPAPSGTTLVCAATAVLSVVVTFAEAPEDHEAKARRMEMIVASFADLLGTGADVSKHRSASPERSLTGELGALAGRAGALCALVVDAASPVVWGASDVSGVHEPLVEDTYGARLYHKAALAGLHFDELISAPVLDPDAHSAEPEQAEGDEPESLSGDERAELWRRVLLVRNALSAVRALPHVATLHKGDHLHESVRSPELSYVVRSFATIYMLLLVFERPFDELRAERSVSHALPTIERLVLALPPREPEPPMAGVGVVRLRRR